MRMTVSTIASVESTPFVCFFGRKTVDDGEPQRAERILWHLSQVEKTYKVEKQNDARDLLLHQAFEGGAKCMQAVQIFKQDPRVLHTFRKEASMILLGHTSRARYNTYLGLMAARLMFL
jgi:hypothetical protein